MIKLLLTAIISVSVNVGYCQWVQVGSVSTNRLNAVKFFNENTGLVAGATGIWRTTNGGYYFYTQSRYLIYFMVTRSVNREFICVLLMVEIPGR
jgi:hypothetical protein